MAELSHLDDAGRARMVDIGGKSETARRAVAEAVVSMSAKTADLLYGGDLPKGDALAVARIAAIMAAKRTSELVPLCHPIALDSVEVTIDRVPQGARVEAEVRTTGATGVEMEAMTAAAVGAITLYDMVKGTERGVTIEHVRLLHKSGGRSGEWNR